MIWYENNRNDITISTRIRLARNLDGVPFPNALKDKSGAVAKIKEAVLSGNSTLASAFDYVELDALPATRRKALAEEHLISFEMLEGNGKSVLISKDKTMSIMLMEEDHIRLQIILGGMALDQAWDTANKVDDVLEERLTYAFDEELGYLTACPTNTGTGLRASVMMHLPALTLSGSIPGIISSAGNMGIAVRGLYGEGSKAYGSFYQISNQTTEGESETDIIRRLTNLVNRIAELERQARKGLYEQNGTALEDRLYRSYGTLKYARSVSSAEAKSFLSDVLLGQHLGIIKEAGDLSPIECMVKTEPAMLCAERDLNAGQRDRERARFLREKL